jgi:small subunit ribosomal protein S29e/phospholipase B1
VFSAGGDKYSSDFGYELAVTIPNFLLHYNPNLQGQSYGESIPLTKGTYLNGAVSGAKVEDVPGQVPTIESCTHLLRLTILLKPVTHCTTER